MADDARPVVIAYDGSAEADAAVREAAGLFPGRRQIVVTVWEPGLALAMAPLSEPTGVGYMPPNFEAMEEMDRGQRDRAADLAEAGAQIARELGAEAEAASVADETHVARTIAELARTRDACAVVVGSRGRGGVTSRLFGSTTRDLLSDSDRPVVVVKRSEGGA